MNILEALITLLLGEQKTTIPAKGDVTQDYSPGIINKIFQGTPEPSPNIWPSPIPTSTPRPSPTPTPTPMNTPPPDRGAEPYYKVINNAAAQNEIPQDILYRLLKRESMSFNPRVISGQMASPAGAMGIAQFMPQTAASMGINPLNPNEAIGGAGKYLKGMYDRFGDWPQALAGYNAGPGAVNQYGGIPPYKETQDYVSAILSGLGYGY